MNSFRYYLPGFILILIAIIIVAVPEILIAFLSTLIIITGIGALYIGHMIRKSETGFRNGENMVMEHDFFGRRFARGSIFRKCFR